MRCGSRIEFVFVSIDGTKTQIPKGLKVGIGRVLVMQGIKRTFVIKHCIGEPINYVCCCEDAFSPILDGDFGLV